MTLIAGCPSSVYMKRAYPAARVAVARIVRRRGTKPDKLAEAMESAEWFASEKFG